eukprot:1173270-Prorocentrum_minimum.AAC.1
MGGRAGGSPRRRDATRTREGRRHQQRGCARTVTAGVVSRRATDTPQATGGIQIARNRARHLT